MLMRCSHLHALVDAEIYVTIKGSVVRVNPFKITLNMRVTKYKKIPKM